MCLSVCISFTVEIENKKVGFELSRSLPFPDCVISPLHAVRPVCTPRHWSRLTSVVRLQRWRQWVVLCAWQWWWGLLWGARVTVCHHLQPQLFHQGVLSLQALCQQDTITLLQVRHFHFLGMWSVPFNAYCFRVTSKNNLEFNKTLFAVLCFLLHRQT